MPSKKACVVVIHVPPLCSKSDSGPRKCDRSKKPLPDNPPLSSNPSRKKQDKKNDYDDTDATVTKAVAAEAATEA